MFANNPLLTGGVWWSGNHRPGAGSLLRCQQAVSPYTVPYRTTKVLSAQECCPPHQFCQSLTSFFLLRQPVHFLSYRKTCFLFLATLKNIEQFFSSRTVAAVRLSAHNCFLFICLWPFDILRTLQSRTPWFPPCW